MSDKESGPVLDPKVVEEVEEADSEEDLFAEYFNTGGGGSEGEKLDVTREWFPTENQWQGKTNIRMHQARCLAIIRHYFSYFDEIDDLEPLISGMVTDYEMYLTSVEGMSRKEHEGILRSMFGGGGEKNGDEGLARLFVGNVGDDDD